MSSSSFFFLSFVEDGTNSLSFNMDQLDVNSEVIHHNDDNEKEILSASQEDKNTIKKEMCRLTNLLNGNMTKNAANKLLRNLQLIKEVKDFDKLYVLKSKVQKKIKVQPTSINRRRPGLTRSGLRIPAGRPPFKLLNRGLKRKRCLNENIDKNQTNAKSHGLNH